jgi:hypothetical protein
MKAMKRWVVLLVAATPMLLLGCGSDDPTPATASGDDRASTSAASEAPAESPLEGNWRTEPISVRDAETTLRRHGLAEWIDEFRKIPPFSEVTVLDLSIEDGQWNLYGESEGGREPIDYDAEYEIDGNTVVFHHSDGSNLSMVGRRRHAEPRVRAVDPAWVPRDPGRGVPARAVHD